MFSSLIVWIGRGNLNNKQNRMKMCCEVEKRRKKKRRIITAISSFNFDLWLEPFDSFHAIHSKIQQRNFYWLHQLNICIMFVAGHLIALVFSCALNTLLSIGCSVVIAFHVSSSATRVPTAYWSSFHFLSLLIDYRKILSLTAIKKANEPRKEKSKSKHFNSNKKQKQSNSEINKRAINY